MKKAILAFTLGVSSMALFAGGCAKREMVKKDESVPAVASAKPAGQQPSPPTAGAMAKATAQKAEAPAANLSATAADKPERAELAEALQKIYFDFDSYTLSGNSRSTLAENAAVLKKRKDKVRIEGNCDERGSDDYNLALGERRAKTAMKYLVAMGVEPSRISVISYGKEKPADPAHTEEAWRKNRRDEFILVK